MNRDRRKMVVAVAIDGNDGETRITKGKDLRIIGGSHETHEHLQEVACKTSEKLKRKGRTLGDICSQQELRDLTHECGG